MDAGHLHTLRTAVTILGVIGTATFSTDATLGGMLVLAALVLAAPAAAASRRLEQPRDR